MSVILSSQLELLVRLIVAGICGSLIGYERKNRLKEAGIRTHMIVALGSALVMIVSKYGFADVLLLHNYILDPSRVAAQIVSGIGFLGAGIIFVRKQAISGLTTAAGIWATAGIGMAIGAKLYFMGISATVLILLVQIIMHKNLGWLSVPYSEQINIEFSENADAISFVQKRFADNNIKIINIKVERTNKGFLDVELYVKMPADYDISHLMDLFKDNPHVRSVEY
ncbi:MgtC/SapB family protein [Pectinatus frisingensis]|jgi:putative Mg2+ transporter-C (MgtC) family protein|uniref:MgtC/SapB family protein n=1 Tax=Pectinatus frisingensis TaxID=865 RepID=UPI0015F3988C|nr:MgtC/SapB family protein [Pectinatus frisingensis]